MSSLIPLWLLPLSRSPTKSDGSLLPLCFYMYSSGLPPDPPLAHATCRVITPARWITATAPIAPSCGTCRKRLLNKCAAISYQSSQVAYRSVQWSPSTPIPLWLLPLSGSSTELTGLVLLICSLPAVIKNNFFQSKCTAISY